MRIFLSIALIINCLLLSGQQLIQSETASGSTRFGITEKKELSRLYAPYPGGSSLSYDLIRGREFFPYYLHSVSTPVLFYGEKYYYPVFSVAKYVCAGKVECAEVCVYHTWPSGRQGK